MRKHLSISLILLILLQSFAKVSFLAYYELNKREITEQLCVNKNRPELNCLGKCYVEKSLKKMQKKTEGERQKIEETPCSSYIFPSEVQLFSIQLIHESPLLHPERYFLTLQSVVSNIFHPPAV